MVSHGPHPTSRLAAFAPNMAVSGRNQGPYLLAATAKLGFKNWARFMNPLKLAHECKLNDAA
jgi:hypothetical protein